MQRVAGDAAVKNADRQRGYKESRHGPPAKGREGFHDVAFTIAARACSTAKSANSGSVPEWTMLL